MNRSPTTTQRLCELTDGNRILLRRPVRLRALGQRLAPGGYYSPSSRIFPTPSHCCHGHATGAFGHPAFLNEAHIQNIKSKCSYPASPVISSHLSPPEPLLLSCSGTSLASIDLAESVDDLSFHHACRNRPHVPARGTPPCGRHSCREEEQVLHPSLQLRRARVRTAQRPEDPRAEYVVYNIHIVWLSGVAYTLIPCLQNGPGRRARGLSWTGSITSH